MTPAAAELMYIKLAQQLPEYGHQSFQKLVSHSTGTTCVVNYYWHTSLGPGIHAVV